MSNHHTDHDDVVVGSDGVHRCRWCIVDPDYVTYHDQEWGFPQRDDTRLFEKICLEGFQAGLSWLTILRKREQFRKVFHSFDIQKVARMTDRDVDRLLLNSGIVRHRGKIESTINNARCALKVVESFGSFASHVWSFAPAANRAAPRKFGDVPAHTPESKSLSTDLKKRGFSFVGPTTMYAFMQAVGMVNDHLAGCSARQAAEHERLSFDLSHGG
ncbi:MAG TPA: DNA-3-methyladenine glycosylase I [Phycisphaerales bacterium]|nr:DNA-3-methyladenine glycosylase I [Phycisphaerales bacterium]HRQ74335.1 DNA-3-methyladenine glycosylase I [Phycisphaerales bacterium]